MTIYEEMCRAEAQRRGIDPNIAVQAANTEGGVVVPARRGTFPTGSSWWMFQLHYGGPGYEQYGTVAGMGGGFTAFTGWQPGDPHAWRDALRYSLDEIKRAGWSKWYGPATVGITGMRGVDPNFHWPGTPAGEWDFRKGVKAPIEILYDPDARIDAQPDDWSCSIQSAEFFLRTMGRKPDDNWIQSQLLEQGIVTTQDGLMDASGGQLARWLTYEYGSEGGWVAQASPVSFDDVAAGAGVNPTMIGGRAWNHWAGVRKMTSAGGGLALANPSDGWMGVGQIMTRDQFARLGPFTAVWIDRMSTLTAPPVPPVPPEPTIDRAAVTARLRALLALHDEYDAKVRQEYTTLLMMVEAL
jgi:hypothetical protein